MSASNPTAFSVDFREAKAFSSLGMVKNLKLIDRSPGNLPGPSINDSSFSNLLVVVLVRGVICLVNSYAFRTMKFEALKTDHIVC